MSTSDRPHRRGQAREAKHRERTKDFPLYGRDPLHGANEQQRTQA